MKMEILLEPTSNKLMVEHAEFDESNANVLERFYTSAGNPVKEILLKLNLPDHRIRKDGGEVKEFQRSFRHSDTERLSRSDEVLKLKNFKKDATLKLFKSTNQESILHSDPIIASSSPSFTPFEGGDFILEEIETFLHTPDELSNLDDDYYDTEGDILYLEKLLNEDPSSTLPPMKNDDLKQVDVTLTKPSIEEPPELELKDLPSHLEYAFLEGTDKLPVIISKELKDEEKAALLKVLKSHKWAIAWKISDIKGIDLVFVLTRF
ncbi:hypothetical protein Tco_1055633 [Tanacetum coccineum]|uniref:Reverse transcriptase domain-containing protein n=1 Tax=Tanacetum coccineum TaxID=301880 RepID=A0ABQ5H074_9ASTR